MSLVIDLIDLVAKHKSGELRCPATALITYANTRFSHDTSHIDFVLHVYSKQIEALMFMELTGYKDLCEFVFMPKRF